MVLNESAECCDNTKNKKYIFSGVFTACSVPGHVIINRNNRSYPEKEVLKHLSYLRESIQQNGCLLGELDHPEGRFDIQLKEASHKITDLWYDLNTHCVMGKLELLDTPNGKIAQQLVDAKYPLFVSSRAAGDIDEKTHEVNIAQIFTYDIVCTPGFQEARLNQISESLDANAYNYLTESINSQIERSKSNTKILLEGVSVTETKQTAPISEKAMRMKNLPINLRNLCTPLLEDEEFSLPEADVTPEGNPAKPDSDSKENDSEKSSEVKTSEEPKKEEGSEDTKKDGDEAELTKEEKEANKNEIISIVTVEKSEDEELSDEDADKNGNDIISIEAQEKKDDDEKSDDSEKSDKESDDVAEATSKKILSDTKKDMDKFQGLLDNLAKVENVKESIVKNYPFSVSLSPDNFAKFAALSSDKKQKCMQFIIENNIFDIKSINDLWRTPLDKERKMLKNWLRLASPEDIELYNNATFEEQNAIEKMASYCILETKQDVEDFWFKTGLRQRHAKQQMNEEFVKRYKIQQKPLTESQKASNPLGYSMDYVTMTEELYDNM